MDLDINMSYHTFNEWLQKKDIFGFTKHIEKPKPDDNDKPVDMINCEEITLELMRHDLGYKKPNLDFIDQITWGDKNLGEALRVDLSPLGSLRVTTRRFVQDLEGVETWICKSVVPLPDWHEERRETNIAIKLFEKLEEIDKTGLDSAKSEYDVEKLVVNLAGEIKFKKPCQWMMYDRVKKLTNEHYLILLNMTGNGQEPSAGSGLGFKIEQYQINVFWDKRKGLLRCFGNSIQSPKRYATWSPGSPDWDEHFAPTQSKHEICDAIVKSLGSF